MAPLPAPGPETVLGKTMKILLAVTVEDTILGFAELQVRTGLPKATLHRLLGDLVGAEHKKDKPPIRPIRAVVNGAQKVEFA